MSTDGPVTNAAFADALQRARQLAAKIGSGEKRPHEDGEANAAKRPNNELNNMVPSSNPNEPTMVEQIQVPDNMVGLIIGRGGEQISNIQLESGCRVQMAHDSGGLPTRQVTLTGTPSSIDRAKQLVNEVISKAGGTVSMGGSSPMMGMPSQMQVNNGGNNTVLELILPGPKVGLIIGKGGEHLKKLQDELGVRMIVIQDSNNTGMTEKPMRIIGPHDKCEIAKNRIMEKIQSRPDDPMFQDGGGGGGGGYGHGHGDYGGGMQKSIGEVIVPRIAVGVIIGKSGEMIKKLQAETGAKVQFKQGEDPNASERTAVLTGSPDQIQKATQMITELVNQAVSKSGMSQQEVFYMHVPSNKTGLVIGKGGETIRQINQESSAHVELSRDAPPNQFEKIFVIKGNGQQIHHAQHLIRIRVGDIPPGTPVPPYTGSSNGVAPSGGGQPAQSGGAPNFGFGYNYANSGVPQAAPVAAAPVSAAPSADPNAAAWAAYYQQYYQQQNQAQAAYQQQPQGGAPATAAPTAGAQAPQQGGSATAAPTINPHTGQPDYSAQWAEYYRSLGMHDQAALIEQQAKQNQANAAVAQVQGQATAYSTAQQQQQAYPQQQSAQQQPGQAQFAGYQPQQFAAPSQF